MPRMRVGDLSLEVVRHGAPNAPAMVLIRGLGSQLINWPAALVDGLVAAGLQVITFDNRDAGLSDKVDAPYHLRDMAEDVRGLLDALGLARAHILGISMGGLIAQILALHHGPRVRSATLVMTTSGAPDLPPPAPKIAALLASAPAAPGQEGAIAHGLRTGRAWGSPAWPFDITERARLLARAYDRCHDPAGTARQHAALMAAISRPTEPDPWPAERISVPVLVIHGRDDTIFPPAHGRDLAARCNAVDYVEIAGMGHDLEGPLPERVVHHICKSFGPF